MNAGWSAHGAKVTGLLSRLPTAPVPGAPMELPRSVLKGGVARFGVLLLPGSVNLA